MQTLKHKRLAMGILSMLLFSSAVQVVSAEMTKDTPLTASEGTAGTYTLQDDEQRNITFSKNQPNFNSKHSALASYDKFEKTNNPKDLTVDLNGHSLTLGVISSNAQVATVYAGQKNRSTKNVNLTINDTKNQGSLFLSAESKKNKQTNAIRVENKSTLNIEVPVIISSIKTTNIATGIYVGKDSSLTITKKLTLANVDGLRNISTFPTGITLDGENSKITIDEVDISKVKGIALYSGKNSKIQGSKKTILSIGGGKITVPEDTTNKENFWAVYAYEGNILLNKEQNHDLVITGNMFADSSNSNASDRMIDVSFTTKNSIFTGAIKSTDKGFSSKGITNLTLTNGATWNHEVQSGILKGDSTFTSSKLTNFTGGSSLDKAGIIKQGEKNISIGKYSGNTRIIFKHDANNPLIISGGDITINEAFDNSYIVLSTNPSANINATNAQKVLNALAGKLTYYKADHKLKGKAEISEGLLSSSATYTGDITFGANKKGTVDETTGSSTSTEQQKTEFTRQITSGKVQEYIDDHVEKETEPGTYKFTKDTTIKVQNTYNGAIYGQKDAINIDAQGKNLTIDSKGTSFITGIYAYGDTGLSGNKAKPINIKAKTLTINTNTQGKTYGIYGQNDGKLIVEGDTVINAKGGVGSDVTGIEATGVSTISLKGLTLKQDKSVDSHRAIRNTGKASKIFVNISDDKNTFYDKNVIIQGNILTDNDNASAETEYPETHIALTTDTSSFTGAFATQKGKAYLYLKNNATWNNENYVKRETTPLASRLTKLTGGEDESAAGNIYMKNKKDLTIDNYSGYTNFFFKHEEGKAENIIGGNVKIIKAEENSHATLFTDKTDVNTTNLEQVLNSLANKLYYQDSATSHNLTATLKVVEGLTASGTVFTGSEGYIVFDDSTHQGKYQKTKPNYDVQKKDKFNTPITNNDTYDTDYINDHVRKIDGSYVFTKDKTIIATRGAGILSDTYFATIVNLDDTNKDLNINLNGHELGIKNENTGGRRGRRVGIFVKKNAIVIDKIGKLDISTEGNQNATTILALDGGKITLSGNDKKAEIKLRTQSTNSNVVEAKGSSAKKSTILMNVLADIEAEGDTNTALLADNGEISVAGGKILTKKGALLAKTENNGKILINVAEDSSTQELTPKNDDTTLTGDFVTGDYKDNAGVLSLALSTKQSSWTGDYTKGRGTMNLFLKNGATWTGKTSDTVDMHLNIDKALWKLKGSSHVTTLATGNLVNHNVIDLTKTQNEDKLAIDNFSGKATFYYDNAVKTVHDPDTNIDKKEGHVQGATIHVKKAKKGSNILLQTASKGKWDWTTVAPNTEKNFNFSMVKLLANHLFYEEADADKLSLTVKISEELTASSRGREFTKDDGLFFDKNKNGQADFKYTPLAEPMKVVVIDKTTKLEKDFTATANKPNVKADGSNMSVAALFPGNSKYNKKNPMIVDMNGHSLTLRAESDDKQTHAIAVTNNAVVNIKNDQKKPLTISAVNTDTRAATGIYVGANAELHIEGPVVIEEVRANNHSISAIKTGGSIDSPSTVVVDGDLTINNMLGKTDGTPAGDGRNLDAIRAMNGQSLISINGKADIQNIKGSVLRVASTTGYEAGGTINIAGGTLSTAKDTEKNKNYRVLTQNTGIVNINFKDANPSNNTTVLKGDLYAVSEFGKKAAEYSPDLATYECQGTLNVALMNKDSKWHGAFLYENTTYDRGTGGKTTLKAADFTLYLQNGAKWINEQLSSADKTWQGSHVKKFVGGTDSKLGVVQQKDEKPITIDNYSGNTIFYFDHDIKNGFDKNHDVAKIPTIKGGKIIIEKAEAGSVVHLRTGEAGFTFDSDKAIEQNLINATLNGLANKLSYKNYKNQPEALKALVEIGEGLVTSSAKIQKEISTFEQTTAKEGKDLQGNLFNNEAGEGAYIYKPIFKPRKPQSKTVFDLAITGDFNAKTHTGKDLEYVKTGVLYEGEYTFTKDTTISPNAGSAIENLSSKKNLPIQTVGAKLTVQSKDWAIEAADKTKITLTGDKNITLKGDKGSILANQDTQVTVKAEGLHLVGNLQNNGGILLLDSGKEQGTFNGNISQTGGTLTLNLKANNSAFNGDIENKKGNLLVDLTGENATFSGKVTGGRGRSTEKENNTEIRLGKKGKATFKDHSVISKLTLAEGSTVEAVANKKIQVADLETKKDTTLTTKEKAQISIQNLNARETLTFNGEGELKAKNLNLQGTTLKKIGTGKVEVENAIVKKDVTLDVDAGTMHFNQLNLEHACLKNKGTQDVAIDNLETKGGKIFIASAAKVSTNKFSGDLTILKEAKIDKNGEVTANNGKFIFKELDTEKENKLHLTAVGMKLEDTRTGTEQEKKDKAQKNKKALLAFYQKTVQADITKDKVEKGKDYQDETGNAKKGYAVKSLKVNLSTTEDLTHSNANSAGEVIFDEKGEAKAIEEQTQIGYGDYETMVMQSTKGAMNSSAMIWRSELNDVMKRLGDLRINTRDQGAWVRVYHGKMSSDKDKAFYDTKYTTTQVGYDWQSNNTWRFGVAGSYLKGSSKHKTGSGDSKLSSVAFYATKQETNGSYLDLIIKVGRLNNEFDVTNDGGDVRAHGDYNTLGKSLSAEYGKRFHKDDGYYIEPQIEFSFGHLDAVDYKMSSNGHGTLNVQQSALDSAIGRVGVALGQTNKDNSWLMKASLYHEFSGGMDTTWKVAGQETKYTKMGENDTWLSLQLGGSIKMSDQTTLYGTFEKTFGGDIKTDYRFDAGVRFSF